MPEAELPSDYRRVCDGHFSGKLCLRSDPRRTRPIKDSILNRLRPFGTPLSGAAQPPLPPFPNGLALVHPVEGPVNAVGHAKDYPGGGGEGQNFAVVFDPERFELENAAGNFLAVNKGELGAHRDTKPFNVDRGYLFGGFLSPGGSGDVSRFLFRGVHNILQPASVVSERAGDAVRVGGEELASWVDTPVAEDFVQVPFDRFHVVNAGSVVAGERGGHAAAVERPHSLGEVMSATYLDETVHGWMGEDVDDAWHE